MEGQFALFPHEASLALPPNFPQQISRAVGREILGLCAEHNVELPHAMLERLQSRFPELTPFTEEYSRNNVRRDDMG